MQTVFPNSITVEQEVAQDFLTMASIQPSDGANVNEKVKTRLYLNVIVTLKDCHLYNVTVILCKDSNRLLVLLIECKGF